MLKVNEEFKALIPALSKEEFEQLEQNILAEGIRESIIVWNNTVIDGHNRYEIACKHDLKYSVTNKEFKNEKQVIEWMILNQFGRRNLSNYQRSLLAIRLKPVFEEKAKENQQLSQGQGIKGCQKSDKVKIDTKKELAKIAGVSHDTIAKVQKIEEKAPDKVKEQIRTGQTTINKAYNDIRNQEKRQEIKIEKPKKLDGKYDIVLADPPWKYDFAESETRAIENHYPTMDLEDIKNIKIPSADDSVLFLWATAPKLIEALEVMKAWGYIYKTQSVWDKELIGSGYWFRGQHEILLVGVKGKYSPPIPENREGSVYREKRTQHSRKPIHYYEMIEKSFPNQRYLEMFSRKTYNENWAVWGNQSE